MIQIEWDNVKQPVFSLETPENVLVTQSNRIMIRLENMRSSDPELQVEYTLTPVENVDQEKLTVSADQTILIIEENALQFATTYTLEVTITNLASINQDAITVQTYEFTTTNEPIAGQITVTPQRGIMFNTEFNIAMSGYSSDNMPLSYQLYGVTSQTPYKRLQLTTSMTEITDPSTSVFKQLPYMVSIQAEIYDSIGEYVTSETIVTIERNEQQNWSEIVQQVSQDQYDDPAQKWQYLSFIGFQANEDAARLETEPDDVISVNFEITQEAVNDVLQINQADDSQETQDNLK